MQPSSSRLASIDALRGLACLAVIAIHSSQHSPPFDNWLNIVIQQGKYGVQLFYVISAFTLFLSLDNRKQREPRPYLGFLLRRYFRIAPMFYCAVVFYLIRDGFGSRYWLGDAPGITPLNILATVTFTNSFHPYWITSIVPGGWSVAIEMLFYWFVPFLFEKIKSLKSAVIFTAIALGGSLSLAYLGRQWVPISDKDLWGYFLYLWLPNQLPVFGLGFVLFFLYKNLYSKIEPSRNHRQISTRFLLICLFIWGVLISTCGHLEFGKYILPPVYFLYGITFLPLTLALLINPHPIFVNPFSIYFGKVSYSAYLSHFAVLPLVQEFIEKSLILLKIQLPATAQYLVTFSMAAIATLLVSAIAYYLIEQPGQALGKVINQKLQK